MDIVISILTNQFRDIEIPFFSWFQIHFQLSWYWWVNISLSSSKPEWSVPAMSGQRTELYHWSASWASCLFWTNTISRFQSPFQFSFQEAIFQKFRNFILIFLIFYSNANQSNTEIRKFACIVNIAGPCLIFIPCIEQPNPLTKLLSTCEPWPKMPKWVN